MKLSDFAAVQGSNAYCYNNADWLYDTQIEGNKSLICDVNIPFTSQVLYNSVMLTSEAGNYAYDLDITKLKWIVPGGETGQESIFNGLRTLKEDSQVPEDAIVMVHDGNRPMVSSMIISDSLATFSMHGSAVAVIPCTEVVFESDDGISSCASTERERLFRTQTPHTYLLNDLYEAHLEAQKTGITGTAASCMLMKELGKTTWFSKGSEENLKITTLDDLRIFKALLHTAQDNWIKE
jgi:2-C-methyl-D-erythritol 4-phosphate cytidylyltransferase